MNLKLKSHLTESVRRHSDAQQELLKSHRSNVEGILSNFGCDATCLKEKPLNVAKMISECGCPTEQADKKVEEPETIELATSSDDNVDVDGVKMTGYTIGIIIIFCLQIFFCIGICFYSQGQVAKAKKESVEQQAQFYQFLFQFHKQMADEENNTQGRRATGGTPGGKRD